jgi:hypothetical protein
MSYMNRTSRLDEILNDAPYGAFDLDKAEPGMKLQHLDRGMWHDAKVDGKQVLTPFKIEALPPGKYRLVE